MSHVMRKSIYAICDQQRHADQPVHPRSLISAFVVRCLDSIIPEISSLYLVSMAAKAGLSLPLVANPKDRFSCDEAHI